MNIFSIIDCNNFYCSCERVFDPRLEGKPVIVPGEIELRNMARQRSHGIDIDAAVLSLLQQRAAQS